MSFINQLLKLLLGQALVDPNVPNLSFDRVNNLRKIRLLQIICLIMIVVNVLGITDTVLSAVFLNMPLMLAVALILLVAVPVYIYIGRLAQHEENNHRASLLLVVTEGLLAASSCYVMTPQTMIPLVFLITISLSIVLLPPGETVWVVGIILIYCCLWLGGFYLNIFHPVMDITPEFQFLINLFVLCLVFPCTCALLVIPMRNQLKANADQYLHLQQVLHQLEERQHTSQIVGKQVLSVAAQLTSTATQQASGSQEQASVVMQVDGAVSELSAASANIARLAEKVNQSVHLVATDSQAIEETTITALHHGTKGLEAVAQTISVTDQAATLYQQLVATMNDLSHKSSNMRLILNALSSIAGETHLLSLNAAIEAAGAGEYGQRFAVVAQEVKELASRSTTASKEVSGIIDEIEMAIKEAVTSSENGYSQARAVQTVAQQTGSLIEKMQAVTQQSHAQATSIKTATESVRQLTETIWNATAQQLSSSSQVLEALKDLTNVAEQSAQASTLVSLTADELEDLSQHLNLTLAAPDETILN